MPEGSRGRLCIFVCCVCQTGSSVVHLIIWLGTSDLTLRTLLRGRTFGSRTRAIMEAAPGSVLLAVISPVSVASRPADLVALAITILAAFRLPMLLGVTVAMGTAGVLRHWLTF